MRFDRLKVRDLGVFEGEHEWEFPSGLVAICGPNGAGKTTLLGLLLGGIYRDVPTRGSLVALAKSRDAYVEVDVTNGKPWRLRQSCDATARKSEALVMRRDGTPEIESTKVRDADAWVAAHFPPVELVLNSLFAAQGAGGFVTATAGERKAILLRLQGIERIEVLAKTARDRAALVQGEAGKLEALIAAERDRGDADALQIELTEARGQAQAAAERAKAARADRDAARDAWARHEAAMEAHHAAQAAQRKLEGDLDRARTRLGDLQKRLKNNRAILGRSGPIRAAAERLAAVQAAAGKAAEAAATARGEASAARAQADAHEEALGAAENALAGAERRLLEQTTGAAVEAVRAAKRALAGKERLRAEAVQAQADADAALADLQGQHLAGAEERLGELRGGLFEVCASPRPKDVARRTLQIDDDRVAVAQKTPAAIRKATAAQKRARADADKAELAYQQTATTAARLQDIDAGAKRAKADVREAEKRVAQLRKGTKAADRLERAQTAVAAADADVERLTTEAARLKPDADKLRVLENAEARIAELNPQAREWRKTMTRLANELKKAARIEPPQEPPAGPDPTVVMLADANAQTQAAAVAALEERLRVAQEAQRRIAALVLEQCDVANELADWTRLGTDLGRKGLQAALIDAALGEVTGLTNELLHSSFGPRWSVRFETQRTDARKQRQLEGLDIWVIDTERGREAPVETYSGGERTILAEAISLALSALACRRMGVDAPTLVRDESGAALDPEKAEAYVAMLRRAADLIHAESVLLVSHSPAVQALCDSRIDL